MQPQLPELEERFSALRSEVETQLGAILDRDVFARSSAPAAEPSGFLSRLLGKKAAAPVATRAPELLALEEWQSATEGQMPELQLACLRGLQAIVGGIVGQRGRLLADKALIVRLAGELGVQFLWQPEAGRMDHANDS